MGRLRKEGAMNCAPTKKGEERRAFGSTPSFFVSIAYKGLMFTGRVEVKEETGTACRDLTGLGGAGQSLPRDIGAAGGASSARTWRTTPEGERLVEVTGRSSGGRPWRV